MSIEKPPFLFVRDTGRITTEQDFLLKLPKAIQSAEDLFAHYEKHGNFPGYFGANWNALLDCLRDLSWIDKKRILIIHDDLPLVNDVAQARTYLEILETAVNDWRQEKEGPFAPPPQEMTFVEHEILVVFPVTLKTTILSLLGIRSGSPPETEPPPHVTDEIDRWLRSEDEQN